MADVIAIWRVLNLLLFLFSGRCYNHLGWCYCLLWFFVLADVIANVFVAYHITTYVTKADVIACFNAFVIGWCYANVCGRCYVHVLQHKKIWLYYCHYVVDVITTRADDFASLFCYWLMLMPMCGRWHSHFFLCDVVADVIAKWQMEWPLQGGWY